MDRRSFITNVAETLVDNEGSSIKNTGLQYANKRIPVFNPSKTNLNPYTGSWNFDVAAHLLRRTLIGPTKMDINWSLAQGLDNTINQLFAISSNPAPPLNVNATDTAVPVGSTWINATFDPLFNSSRTQSLKAWWIGELLKPSISIRERMLLMLHNHFVTGTKDVNDARLSYLYIDLLRSFATGNFKELAKRITVDPAMLIYLNGTTNTASSPNENYARELQELFTIGKGPEISQGNYTYYTEVDVQIAAKALTGWRVDRQTLSAYFTSNRHDNSSKQFSSAYANAVIAGNGDQEYKDVVNLIFSQDQTALFICRKLYRYFVYYVIDANTETNIIQPMATLLRNSDFDLSVPLKVLLKSEHFFDVASVGCMIKNPTEHMVGLCKQFAVLFPDATNLTTQYLLWQIIGTQLKNCQMDIGDPPNVAGWPAYYQEPQFYENWINSDTIAKRTQFSDTMIDVGFKKNGKTIIVDVIAFANLVSDPSDSTILINEFAQILFPIPITENQKLDLQEILIPGLPAYEWAIEWNNYIANPTQANIDIVSARLKSLLKFMMAMAEYHLS